MSLFYEQEGKVTTKCYRKRHAECRNIPKTCICMCHVVKQKNEELKRKGTLKTADEYINRLILGSQYSSNCKHGIHHSCKNTKGWCHCSCHSKGDEEY